MTDHAVTLTRRSDRRHKIAVIDGLNMSSLCNRSKQVYGAISSLDDLEAFVIGFGTDLGVDVECFSSDYQGAILEFIHESAHCVDGDIINPAGATTIGEAILLVPSIQYITYINFRSSFVLPVKMSLVYAPFMVLLAALVVRYPARVWADVAALWRGPPYLERSRRGLSQDDLEKEIDLCARGSSFSSSCSSAPS